MPGAARCLKTVGGERPMTGRRGNIGAAARLFHRRQAQLPAPLLIRRLALLACTARGGEVLISDGLLRLASQGRGLLLRTVKAFCRLLSASEQASCRFLV